MKYIFIINSVLILAIFWYLYTSRNKPEISHDSVYIKDTRKHHSAGEFLDNRHDKCNFCCKGGHTEDETQIKNMEKDKTYCDKYNKYYLTSCGTDGEECDRDIECLRDCFKTRTKDGDTITEDDIDICTNEICG